MKKGIAFNKLIVLIIGFVAVIIILIGSFKFYPSLKNAFLGSSEDSEVNGMPAAAKFSNVFYDYFVEDYKSCKLSSDVECYCHVRNTLIPDGFVLEVSNIINSKKTFIKLHSNAEVSGGILSSYAISNIGESEITSKSVDVENDLLLVEDTAFAEPKVADRKLGDSDFSRVTNVFFSGSTLFTSSDLKFRNKIDFSEGIIYRKDAERTFLLNNIEGLARCSSLPNVAASFDAFDSIVKSLNRCLSAPDIKDGKKCASFEQNIPEDYTIKIESSKINLYYKDKLLKSSKELNFVCVFDSPFNPIKDKSSPLNKISFNDYKKLDFYVYSNKELCVAAS